MKNALYDIVIIGNGILGSSLAYQLKKLNPNIHLAMIGPLNRDGSASKAAGAMTNVFGELDVNQLENPALADKFDLALKGSELWDNYIEELNQYAKTPIVHRKGTYLLLNSKSTQIEVNNFNYTKEAIIKKGYTYEKINPNNIPWLKSAEDACPIEVIKIKDGSINTESVFQALDTALNSMNIDIFPTNVIRVKEGKKGVFSQKKEHTLFLASGETLHSKNIVFANGAFAQPLIDNIETLRCEVPRLLYGAGNALDLSFPEWVHKYGGLDKSIFEMDGVLRTMDRGGSCGLHLIPWGNGNFYLGASSGVWFDPEQLPRLHGISSLVHGVVKDFSYAFFFAGMEVRDTGYRPVTVDCFPLIGESHIEGIWFLNGTKRDGFTISPHVSLQMAKAMLGQSHQLPYRFRPSRKLIPYKTQEKAIEAAKCMLIGADRQHGAIQAPYMLGSYQQTRFQWIQNVYEKRNVVDFGIHPEVLHLFENDDFYKMIAHPFEKISSFSFAKSEAS